VRGKTMPVDILTNNHRREILDAHQLPAWVRERDDYHDWDACERCENSVSYVAYRDDYIDLNDVDGRVPEGSELAKLGWDTYRSDSYSTGTVFKYWQDMDNYGDWYIVVGSFHYYGDYGGL